jgi:hypothetical protein
MLSPGLLRAARSIEYYRLYVYALGVGGHVCAKLTCNSLEVAAIAQAWNPAVPLGAGVGKATPRCLGHIEQLGTCPI